LKLSFLATTLPHLHHDVSSLLLHLISHLSQYRTFKTLTQMWFGKMAVTF
jgi:hypothetical protein